MLHNNTNQVARVLERQRNVPGNASIHEASAHNNTTGTTIGNNNNSTTRANDTLSLSSAKKTLTTMKSKMGTTEGDQNEHAKKKGAA